MKILKKDAYVVAAAPAFVFLSVYFYEWGRFSFYKVPPLFISLPTTRLLMAGVAIAFFFVVLFSFLRGVIRRMRGSGKVASVLSGYLAAYLIFGFPLALISVSYLAFLSTFIIPAILVAMNELTEFLDGSRIQTDENNAANPKDDSSGDQDAIASPGSLTFIFVWGLFLIFCFGNGQERVLRGNVCFGDKIVVAVYGDQLILKSFDKNNGEITDPVNFYSVENAEVKACHPTIVGGGGFSGWPSKGSAKAADEDSKE
ncbi:hypothetical protein [Stenotrophomonas sp. LMG 10879]|uniref:hypothetical protein n=1 Tax=Stenotrophomonas sp. LMG 10879 TaxID=487706 RepID=UPI001055DAB1|nr:hypothetical protein [Stenotrophomonas sp. LMG 10879]